MRNHLSFNRPFAQPDLEPTHLKAIQVAQPTPKLMAQWQQVDGKLICKWFNRPD